MNKFVISFKNEGAFEIKTEMNASDVLEKLINGEEWVEL